MATENHDLELLAEFHKDKLSARQRHVAVARLVSDYEFNNAYQYVINREDTHLQWLEAAIARLGGTPATVAEPTVTAATSDKKNPNGKFLPLVSEDSKAAGDLVAKWRPKSAGIVSDRDRKLAGVILGETLEQKRFFDQMLGGQDDLLGRRMKGASTGDGVMPVRWVE
jgi:Mn-containing catalase